MLTLLPASSLYLRSDLSNAPSCDIATFILFRMKSVCLMEILLNELLSFRGRLKIRWQIMKLISFGY